MESSHLLIFRHPVILSRNSMLGRISLPGVEYQSRLIRNHGYKQYNPGSFSGGDETAI